MKLHKLDKSWLAVWLAPLLVFASTHIYAAYTAPPAAWTASYELDPTATDPVSQGDDHLRAMKNEIRNRLETEVDFGELGNVTTDTGRLLEGSARVFVQSAAPTVDGTITAACLAEADYDGNRGCDEGRVWCDSDDDKCYFAEDTGADGDADVWTVISANPAALTASRAVVTDGSGVLAAATTTATEVGYVNGVTSAIQTQINTKAPTASPTFSGTITTPLTASRALVTDGASALAVSATTATELGYVSGVTSSIQTQINGLGTSGLTLLGSYSPAAAASVEVTSKITASYDYYVIVFRFTTDTADDELWARTDDANGASWDSGAGDYEYALQGTLFAGPTSAADTEIVICGNAVVNGSVNSSIGSSGYIIYDRTAASLVLNCGWENAVGNRDHTTGTGRRVSGTPNAVQFLNEVGTITGYLAIYGLKL